MDYTKKKLKPVVYTTSSYKNGAPQTSQQIMLLKAMQVSSDPKQLKDMIGVRTVAEVYRTLDKLQMRKDYHEALGRAGVSFEFIVKGLKDVAMAGEKDGDRLKAMQILLKSLGMDKYESEEGAGGGTFEEVLSKAVEAQEKKKELLDPGTPVVTDLEPPQYEVIQPEMPESLKKIREEEAELTKGVYE